MLLRNSASLPFAGIHSPVAGSAGSFSERHAGWILAVCLHVVFFAWLVTQREQPWIDATPKPRTIVVRLQPVPEPTPEPTAATIAALMPAGDPDRTDGGPIRGSDLADAAAEVTPNEPATSAGEDPAPASPAAPPLPEAVPVIARMLVDRSTSAESPDLDSAEMLEQRHADELATLRERGEQMKAANRQQGMLGSAEVEQRLRLAQADLAAKKTLFHEPILNRGVDREIDISDIEFEKAQQILERYGIKVMILDARGGLPPAPKEGSYINRAVTSSGVFVRPEGMRRGIFKAFTFGPIAEKRMAQLEEEALVAKGLDPLRSRVRRVVFGIISTPAGFDLGVKRIEAEPVPGVTPAP